MTEFLQITTTADNVELLETIASELVSRRLAACVQISGPITSIYRWQGNLERATEWQVTVKTKTDRMPAAMACIRELHTYDVPEIIATPIVDGDSEYFRWIAEQIEDK